VEHLFPKELVAMVAVHKVVFDDVALVAVAAVSAFALFLSISLVC
jgi:hypothetical protein